MQKVYLKLEQVTGRLYQYSKTPGEGFEEFTSSTGKLSYRKYYVPIGTLGSVEIREEKFNTGVQENIAINLYNSDLSTKFYINIPILDSKGNVNDYSQSVIRHLAGLKKDKVYRIFTYRIEPDEGKKYDTRGVSFKEWDIETNEVVEKVEPTLHFIHDGNLEGDIPRAIWEEKMGKNVKNADKRNDFLYGHLKGEAERLKYVGTSSSHTTAATTPVGESITPTEKKEGINIDDDLPF